MPALAAPARSRTPSTPRPVEVPPPAGCDSAAVTDSTTTTGIGWDADVLGDGYERHTMGLGRDPDGEGELQAVLVRRSVREGEQVTGAVIYVHGFSDYFFQTDLADFFAERGLAFYGLDLRKCGRARQPGQTAHYVSDLAHYDEELERSLEIVAGDHPGLPVVVAAHSTGGLVTPLWLDRRRRAGRVAPVAGLVLNSPWFDLQGKPMMRGPVTWLLRALSRVRPFRPLDLPESSVYGHSLHVTGNGEWDYDLDLKPMTGFPVTVGWLAAVRRGHARLHRGLDIGVPALVLRSDRTHFSRTYSEASDRADTVLDVRHIARWSTCLGNRVSAVPIPGGRHDLFLSQADAREATYRAVDFWLREVLPA